jgi:hypothetical protein
MMLDNDTPFGAYRLTTDEYVLGMIICTPVEISFIRRIVPGAKLMT